MDIEKKILIFKDMWNNGKICYPVKESMSKLSLALKQMNFQKAQQIHVALLVDYVSEVIIYVYICIILILPL